MLLYYIYVEPDKNRTAMRISLQRLSVGVLATLADQTITESVNEKYAVVKDNPLLEKLQAEYKRYFDVFGKKAYSGLGKKLAKADKRRNNAFIGMKFCVYGLTKMEGCNMQQDAVDLYKEFKWVGLDLNRKKYFDKSGKLDELIIILNKPEYQQKIANTNLTEVYGLLSAAQADFMKTEDEQITANTKLRMMESASSLRGNLQTALGNYFRVVTAMKEIEGWDKLYGNLNEFAKSARLSHRMSRKHKEETETNPDLIPPSK